MTERARATRSRRRRRATSAERNATEKRQDAEHDVGALDNPEVPDEPSELRHLAYFGVVVVLAFVLNILAMIVVAGGA